MFFMAPQQRLVANASRSPGVAWSRSPDPEPVESAGVALRNVDSLHTSAGRALFAPGEHRLDLFARTLEPGTHGTIGLVGDPAGKALPLSLLLAVQAEADALDTPVHHHLASDRV
jgi:hypothetical protein